MRRPQEGIAFLYCSIIIVIQLFKPCKFSRLLFGFPGFGCRSHKCSLLLIRDNLINGCDPALRVGFCRFYSQSSLVFLFSLLVILADKFLVGNGDCRKVGFFFGLLSCLLPGNQGFDLNKHFLRIVFPGFHSRCKCIIIPGPDEVFLNIKTVGKADILFVIFLGFAHFCEQSVNFRDFIFGIWLIGFDL